MNDAMWSDRMLRDFITRLRDRDFDAVADDGEREDFLREAQLRLVPEVRRRILAEVGATVDSRGVAAVAFEVLEQESWGRRHTWLMVTTEPWAFLAELVADEVGKAYRASIRSRADSKKLKGIAKASTRAELESGREGGLIERDDDAGDQGPAA
jgi:hypothetical protein